MAGVTSLSVDGRLAPAGGIAAMFAELSARFWDQPHLPAGLIELCRLDLAVLHRATAEQAIRHPAASDLPNAVVEAVLNENWRRGPELTAAEKSALDFTEYYFMDPQSIPDEVATTFLAHFGEPALVCLVEALGFIDSRIRLALIYSNLSA